jgi:hypothetical protein
MAVNTKLSFTDQAAAFSAAAAYRINPQVINTWNPYLIRTPRVLVPISLDALVVRPSQAQQTWADCALKAAPQQTTPVSRYDILPTPFAELKTPRTAGVYLHWALPDALTNGVADGATATFPAAPDRWLILRMYPSANATGTTVDTVGLRAVKGWILRAGDQNPVPIDLDSFVEGPPSQDAVNNPLTVLGTGDVAWAAYYDNSVNRLAFYDSLSDIQEGPLSYLVCGWYSNPGQDPLGDQSVHSLTDFNNKMQQYQWQLAQRELNESIEQARRYVVAARGLGLQSNLYSASLAYNDALTSAAPAVGYAVSDAPSSMPQFDDQGDALGPYTTDGSWWPNATLMHGCVVALGWPGIGWQGNENGLLSGESGGPPAASAINVAVGNTLTEALAALVAQHNNLPDEARILEGFLLSSLADLEQPDGRARLDALLQATAFSSMDGGFTTETINIPAMPDTPPPLPNPVQPGPGVFAGQVAATNTLDTSFQSGIFNRNTVTLGGQAAAKFSESIETIRETTFLEGGLTSVVNAVAPAPAQQQIPAHTEEVRRALPRLFYPSEPVFLLEGTSRTFKYGADTRLSQDNTLVCRLSGFYADAISSQMPASSDPTILIFRPTSTADPILERSISNGSVPPECEDLLREVVILDPSAAVNLAQAALNPVAPFRATATIATAAAPAAAPASTTTPPAAAPKATAPSAAQINAVAKNFVVEQTAWWATRDPRFDHGPLVANSGISGTLPSPIAVTPPIQPWNPIHLDWEIEYIPSTYGIADWSLGEIDYATDPKLAPPAPDLTQQTGPNGQPQPQPPGSLILSGRAHLTGGAAATAAASLRTAMAQAQAAGGAGNLAPNTNPAFHSIYAQVALSFYANMATTINVQITGTNTGNIPPVDRSALQDILDTLDSMDVLAGAADNFTRQMRGGYAPDGQSKPADNTIPTPFVPLRAGFIRILRLRLVDGYGQFLDLASSSDTAIINSTQLIEAESLQTPTRPELLALPPRYTSPARLWFRYLTADGSGTEADATTSPVCGFLMPNHLDGDLEFFDATGANLGFVRPDPQSGIIWEDAPGVPSTVGQSPARAVPNQFAAGIAQGLLQWGLADATNTGLPEDALSAILRIIDSTLWAVDPFGSSTDEHLSLLVGHPVVILRASVKLEVQEPIDTSVINTKPVSLRLGAVPQWQDGLLGYFVNDDYTRLYCADAAIAGFAREVGPGRGFLQQASLVPDYYQNFSNDIGDNVTEGNSPVNHPYVDSTGLMSIQPSQEVSLTLLVEPQCVVHATTGLLPRKEIGMRREWIATALAALSPTFRFGPVLVDPKTIRMPVPNEIHGTWSWDHRADITTWAEDPITNATQDAHLRPDPAGGTEGWMRMMPPPPAGNSKS